MNVLLGVSGSVAATLTPKLQRAIEVKYKLRTVITESTKHFIKAKTLGDCWKRYYEDDEEWTTYEYDQTVLHIDLVKWADVLVIAPCTANTLAKIANGICDNLLTNCVRAWDLKKPMFIAPAMNCVMWNNPITKKHCVTLAEMGIGFVMPQSKKLYCGDEGIGAMAEINDIVEMIDYIKEKC